MSVPPDTLMRAPRYLRSICRVWIISCCCDSFRSSSGTIMMLKLAKPEFTFCMTRCRWGRPRISFSIGLMNSSVRR